MFPVHHGSDSERGTTTPSRVTRLEIETPGNASRFRRRAVHFCTRHSAAHRPGACHSRPVMGPCRTAQIGVINQQAWWHDCRVCWARFERKWGRPGSCSGKAPNRAVRRDMVAWWIGDWNTSVSGDGRLARDRWDLEWCRWCRVAGVEQSPSKRWSRLRVQNQTADAALFVSRELCDADRPETPFVALMSSRLLPLWLRQTCSSLHNKFYWCRVHYVNIWGDVRIYIAPIIFLPRVFWDG